ncbi:cysteine hydrolase family protein [Oceanobacillus sp. 1P07AA]|uniref:cysteine hydrolase family protein n=1 Tax=Oceanobacillus sp. 1P07AA TaxID=3132293 RepID=UPI0039A6169E
MGKSALVIIDVQNAMFDEGVYNGEQLVKELQMLIANARESSVPIFYVQHNEATGQALENGTVGWEIRQEIAPKSQDIVIQKTTPDAFYRTNFQDELVKYEVNHLFLTGIQTEVCVDTTMRSAFSQGYKVSLISNAHSTFDNDTLTADKIIAHHNQTLRWYGQVIKRNECTFK